MRHECPRRIQVGGAVVVPKSVQVRGDRTYANSDVNHKINKTIGSVCGYRSESSRKICPFRFRLMHQIGRMIQSFFLLVRVSIKHEGRLSVKKNDLRKLDTAQLYRE